MAIRDRLQKLEASAALETIESTENDCICFPSDEPPHFSLKAEHEAAKAVLCPLHGVRFEKCALEIYSAMFNGPTHLNPGSWSWRSEQYQKAMNASFPPDRWPATEIVDPDRTVRFVLKDGTEILKVEALYEEYDLGGHPKPAI